MKIKLAYLYYDLLNLYGEQGNVLALVNGFKNQGVEVEIDYLSLNNRINFSKYDLFYIGCGSEENLITALDNIKKYALDIKKAIKENKYFIATGNSHELFGKFIEVNNQKYEGLGIFEYYAKQNPKRIVGESLFKYKDLSPIVGFQNRACVLQIDSNHLFEVIDGYADNFKSFFEGYQENNFIGTYLIGPLLIRNPQLNDYIIKDILSTKNITYKPITNTYEYQAYDEYMKNFYNKS